MDNDLTIGRLAKLARVPAKTIRFYEDEGLLRPPRRSQSGYRLYSDADVSRLQLIRRVRLLGMDLQTVRRLLDRALSDDCAAFADELQTTLARQQREAELRIAELTALREELVALQAHITHCCEGCDPRTMASDCGFCGLVTMERGGESDGDR